MDRIVHELDADCGAATARSFARAGPSRARRTSPATVGGAAFGFRTPRPGDDDALCPGESSGAPAGGNRRVQRTAGTIRPPTKAADVGGGDRAVGRVSQRSQPDTSASFQSAPRDRAKGSAGSGTRP